MLWRSDAGSGKEWNNLTPFLLFAYREVPQASTGFSPFELVFGRTVRGPLDVLRETWEHSCKTSESIALYVIRMCDQLSRMSDLVQENLKKAQDKQKQWYDRNARERTFKKGDQVLILLPTSSKCLLAQWNGPYPVTKTISSVNYEVDMLDKRKCRGISHVNMMRAWNLPTPLSLWTDVQEEQLNEVPTWKEDPSECRPVISKQLSIEQ